MKDPRLETMARGLINYSVELKPGEKILIEVIDSGSPLALAIIREVYKVKGIPFVTVRNKQIDRQIMLEANQEMLEKMAEYEMVQMKEMDAYIGIRAADNASETADVSGEQQQLYMKHYLRPVTERRVNHTKWCIMRYPTPSMAQLAGMSTEGFEDFYFDVCTLDYGKMNRAMQPLKELMERTDQVRITGVGTDLTFSIKGIPAIPCAGKMNIPDGEIFTAPVRDSVNGVITYNTPAVYQGVTHENIRFRFENGKIVEATGNDPERLNKVLDTDEGARFVGEFALGVNPYILKPMKDTLFDEKISGSLHFTPGQAYEEADNKNRSAIHWDLVYIQRPEYGGGEIYFDGKLIRKDGRFVIPELEALNPENLV
ncbi:MAG TPA: aminopeptidase [Bacillota bacterium]|jgi:aminopeptidase|nr:aminopeptidase [Bacillota bacterium]HOL09434.1 aminopeptidase [Bacillota bacterium]HPO98592.1 aminopeptidase [Bacillota bacterium]